MTENDRLGVGMVGYSFMGAAHSQAWRTVGRIFDPRPQPVMSALCGRHAENTTTAAERLGWASVETDWEKLIERPDVELVDICTPGDSHPEIAIAALEAGKHVLCEKPLANSVAAASAMTEAADRASARGIRSMVGFNYRRVPALALARRMVADGRLGTIRHVRAQYLQDFIVDPESPMMWRLDRERAGSGALGDIGAHIVDLTRFVTGQEITGVSGMTETFVHERPLDDGSGAYGRVTVDDAAAFLARLDGGAMATFEATRFATGRKNAMRLELNGSAGSLAFDFESMNELLFHDRTEDAETAGFRRILATEPEHPYLHAWWPPGHGLGYEHTFTHQMRDLLEAIGTGDDPEPSFADGLAVQRVLAAVEHSSREHSVWTEVSRQHTS
ncbi:gfo/Idh/MocA family oxidoreductase [Actinopolyspora erythraea]|uniref:Dehydrogenase n=1 Tax=Actinopolyspora erythraea TaxID=414996 RepID=A0A099D849_9ACTN|nr:Gfo/Idh/MocA family oxidoreductase [Actinopolyspora erythraea]ASU78776.1 gfo/Idh/MocA family oxidoreductase [Actinopolyspora erythraea]KGI81530.1 dehydrogenase [Actinopolyspora erythraea]